LWEFADQVLPRGEGSGMFNQAAMELGALICTPRGPKCLMCPVQSDCAARALRLQETIPGKVKKVQYTDQTEVALLIRRARDAEGCLLMRQIPEGERWVGMWDFPRYGDAARGGNIEGIKDALRLAKQEFGGRMRDEGTRMTIKHAVTRYRITLHVHHIAVANRWSPKSPAGDTLRWVSPLQMNELPLSVSARKIARSLADDDDPLR
ncbi:MAG: NUDIX domain-containing protein, partial [Planctomycetota bacterium]